MKVKKFRSMLYIPGNNPGMLQQATIYGADSVLLDLEDAVAPTEKDSARDLVRHMLPIIDKSKCVITVRINDFSTPICIPDLEAIIPLGVDAIRIPKVENAEQIKRAEEVISTLEKQHNIKNKVEIHAMIETAEGVKNVFDIVKASPRITALTLGAQDLLADMALRRTDYNGLGFAAGQVILAAKVARIHVLDTPFIDVDDEEGLRKSAEYSKSIGFTGKAVINPRQVDIVTQVFSPTPAELDYATRVVSAFNVHKAKGSGVFAIDGKMVDKPVVAQAINVLELADIDPTTV